MARSLGLLLLSLLAFGVALAGSAVGGCNVHEFGHLGTGLALGVPVDDVTWCAPGGGRVAFAYQEPAFVSYAGGFLAALVLALVYRIAILPRLASSAWWAAGVAVLGTAVSQVVVGIWEGAAPRSYAALPENAWTFTALVLAPLLAALAVQLRLRRPRIRTV